MTQEEKYKEALLEARAVLEPCLKYSRGKVREALDSIDKELKRFDSEDERIRKQCIELLREAYSTKYEAFECIAWLEKQKEASKALEAVDRIDKYIDDHLANAHDMKDSNPDKKYYRGFDDALGKMAGILQDVYSGEKQKEQKPKAKAKSPLSPHELYDAKIEGISQGRQDVLDHPEQFGLQKPAEWSDEDKEKIVTISEIIEHCTTIPYSGGTLTLNKEYKKELLCFIRTLRPSWKPSEEQMEALRRAVNKLAKTDVADSVGLSIMYDNLKKL